jgi:FixJ family two-component response regulator
MRLSLNANSDRQGQSAKEFGMDSNTASDGYKVCIVDDDDGFRNGLVRALSASGVSAIGYRCAGEYLLAAHTHVHACMVLDMWMPGPSGMELLHALSTRETSPPVIFVTACTEVPASVQAMKYGAVDFLIKPITLASLLRSVRNAIALDACRRAARAELQQIQARYATLNEDERRVFAGVVAGKLNKQLAAALDTCERTVKTYRATMMRKMQAASLVDLVRAARQLAQPQNAASWTKAGALPELRTVSRSVPLQHGA